MIIDLVRGVSVAEGVHEGLEEGRVLLIDVRLGLTDSVTERCM